MKDAKKQMGKIIEQIEPNTTTKKIENAEKQMKNAEKQMEDFKIKTEKTEKQIEDLETKIKNIESGIKMKNKLIKKQDEEIENNEKYILKIRKEIEELEKNKKTVQMQIEMVEKQATLEEEKLKDVSKSIITDSLENQDINCDNLIKKQYPSGSFEEISLNIKKLQKVYENIPEELKKSEIVQNFTKKIEESVRNCQENIVIAGAECITENYEKKNIEFEKESDRESIEEIKKDLGYGEYSKIKFPRSTLLKEDREKIIKNNKNVEFASKVLATVENLSNNSGINGMLEANYLKNFIMEEKIRTDLFDKDQNNKLITSHKEAILLNENNYKDEKFAASFVDKLKSQNEQQKQNIQTGMVMEH